MSGKRSRKIRQSARKLDSSVGKYAYTDPYKYDDKTGMLVRTVNHPKHTARILSKALKKVPTSEI